MTQRRRRPAVTPSASPGCRPPASPWPPAACRARRPAAAAAGRRRRRSTGPARPRTASCDFANWPLYMDQDGKDPTLKKFTKETGITGELQGGHPGERPWFAKIQPLLAADQSHRLRPDGHHQRHPVRASASSSATSPRWTTPSCRTSRPTPAPKYKNASFDPGNVYSDPVDASGITGIAYNPKYVRTTITSSRTCWNPKYKGKVGMMLRHPGDRQLRHVRARHRPGEVDRGRLAEGRRRSSRSSATPGSSASTTTRTTSTRSPRATSGSPWPGRVTSSSRSPTART